MDEFHRLLAITTIVVVTIIIFTIAVVVVVTTVVISFWKVRTGSCYNNNISIKFSFVLFFARSLLCFEP